MTHLVNLDPLTRSFMEVELENDVALGRLYRSPRIRSFSDYIAAFREAVRNGDEESFGRAVRAMLVEFEPGKEPAHARIPFDADLILAEGEFNRIYLKGLCLRAIEEGKRIRVYRAFQRKRPRRDSERLIGKVLDPCDILLDLRTNSGKLPSLGLPNGVRSGLSGVICEASEAVQGLPS